MKRVIVTPAVIVISAMLLLLAFGAELSAAEFYKGKTVRITVGHSAGGGFDLWARLVARHLGRHIPGEPTVIVENITGAGGLIHVNQLFSATKPDGLTIGHFNGVFLLSAMFQQPGYDFDGQKFIYIGAANKENPVFLFSKKSGITSVDKWRSSATPVLVGGFVPGNSIDNCNRAMKDILGFPTKNIMGYKGTADILIAIDSGELAGGAASWDNIKTNRMRQINAGEAFVLVQCTPKALKQIPNVPKMIDLAKTDDQKRLIEIAINNPNEFSRPFVLTPGTPKDRVDILRKAFQETMKDKEFLAEVDKMQLTLDPTTGDDLAALVVKTLKTDQAIKAKLKDILFKAEK